MEDDFLFFDKMNYVTHAIEGLNLLKNLNVKQVLFNRSYAETIDDYRIGSHKKVPETSKYCIHDYQPGKQFPYSNCHYWPHYSYRPSLIDTEAVLTLGPYNDKLNQHVAHELEYAKTWTEAGYRSAFFNKVTCLHIGRLTSEKGKPNAYDLNMNIKTDACLPGINTHALPTKSDNNVDSGDGANSNTNADSSPKLNYRTYVVNMERRPDRRQEMTDRLKDIDIKYEFYTAVDGMQLKATQEIYDLFAGNEFGNRRGVIGCALTHMRLWQQLLNDPDYDTYLIIEDDTTFAPNFTKDIIDQRFPVTMLGYLNGSGAFCYTVNKKGARILMDYIDQHKITQPIDTLIHICCAGSIQYVKPPVAFSELSETDSDIHAQYDDLDFKDLLKLRDRFIFVPGLDQHGYDLFYKPLSIDEMLTLALEDERISSVNTLGFFKRSPDNFNFDLKPSVFFGKKDGIYIKKLTVKLLCDWFTPYELYKYFNRFTKGNYTWNHLQLTTDERADYYVILNSPQQGYYDPKKTIVFQMEPWSIVSRWGEWAEPDPAKFMAVCTHKTALNNCEWQIEQDYLTLTAMDGSMKKDPAKASVVASICSPKYDLQGHKFRIDFLRFLNSKGDINLNVYGQVNLLGNSVNYSGRLPMSMKSKGILPYKYYFMTENTAEHNYITEKMWECLLCETLCFYWGCPNIEDFIDPRAFVKLDMNDFEGSYQIIKQAIRENWYEQRLPFIKEAKKLVLEKYSFMATIERIINSNRVPTKAERTQT
jgi:hypothetical protein